MTKKFIIDTVKNTIKFESQHNLKLATILFNDIFKSGFQINYYYEYGSISENNLESISRIETLFYSSLPENELTNFQLRSAIYQNTFDLILGEILIYSKTQ